MTDIDELRALVEDPPAPESVVADLAVPHVLVAGHPHSGAVRRKGQVRRSGKQVIERRRAGECNGVARSAS